MKQFFLLIVFGLVSFISSKAQGSIQLDDKPFRHDQPRLVKIDHFLEENRLFKTYTQEEKDVFYWVNVLRSDPRDFLDNYVFPFLDEFPDAKGPGANSLVADLKKQKPLPLLAPEEKLTKAARFMAKNLAQSNRGISHTSTDGKSFRQRMNEVGVTNCAGENILEGKSDALKAVILLLIDEGVPNRGHRMALLNPIFTLMGCSFQAKRSGEGYILVQDFSCVQ